MREIVVSIAPSSVMHPAILALGDNQIGSSPLDPRIDLQKCSKCRHDRRFAALEFHHKAKARKKCDVPARNLLAASQANVSLPLRKPASAICFASIVIANFIAPN